jgi:hypothetical protein
LGEPLTETRSPRRLPRRAGDPSGAFLAPILFVLLSLVVVHAAGAAGLGDLARQARLVVAGQVVSRTPYDDGRIVVARLSVAEVLKGGPLGTHLDVIETRDIPKPPVFIDGSRGVAFLRRASWSSSLAKALPAGTYYEPLPDHAAYVSGDSAAEGKEITTLISRLLAGNRASGQTAAPAKARKLTFDLLAAGHPVLVGEGARRLAARRALEGKLDDGEVKTLDRTLGRSDLPAHVRVDLIRSLAAAGITQAVPALQRIDSPPDVMESAWQALDRLGAAPKPERIEELLVSRDAPVRAAAVRELLRREGVNAVSRAAPVALQDSDESVRLAAVEALGSLGRPEALPPLERVFAEAEGALRQAAGRSILAVGGQPAADAFARLALTAPPDAQRYAVVLLMTMGAEQNSAQLERIAEQHPREDVRDLIEHGLPIHEH